MKNGKNQDFKEFCTLESRDIPCGLNDRVISKVRRDLEPEVKEVCIKLIMIQGVVGILTLFFCPQFQLSFTANHEIYHFFHRNFGTYGCMAVCGALFMGCGAVVASTLLRLSELDLILRSKYLLTFSLSGLAVLLFLGFGAEIYLELAAAWIAGGAIASIIAIDGTKAIRLAVLQFGN